MPDSNAVQATGSQIALPTDKLQAIATTYLKNEDNGAPSQMQKALEVASYFLSGCMAVNISQFLGSPLYLINQDWYNAWIALTKQSFGLLTTTLTQYWAPTVVRVSGDKSVRGELIPTANGGFKCKFPQRMVIIANHQIYTDWLYLWWIAYCNGMHGSIFIVLKESLKRIPVIGWGMRFSQFIFLKRNWEQDQPEMAKHFQKLNKITRPMWLLIFPEGTNLAASTRERSANWAKKNGISDLQHTILPRSTGLRFCLQQLRGTVKYVYDCTIAYEGVPRGQYAQDIFTVNTAYFEGQPPKSVNMYWRRFAVSSMPLDDPVAFEIWLRARWMEKDGLIEAYYRNGRFPADRGAHKMPDGRIFRGAGHIETEVKSNYWYEFLQIFAPVGVLALVLYTFYNALPTSYTKSLSKENTLKKAEQLQKTPINLQRQRLLDNSDGNSTTKQDSLLVKGMEIYSGLSKNEAIRKVAQLPELTPAGLKKEIAKHQPALDTIFTQKNALHDLKTKLPPPRSLEPSSKGAIDQKGKSALGNPQQQHSNSQFKSSSKVLPIVGASKNGNSRGLTTGKLQTQNLPPRNLGATQTTNSAVNKVRSEKAPGKKAPATALQHKTPRTKAAIVPQAKAIMAPQKPKGQSTAIPQNSASDMLTTTKPALAQAASVKQTMKKPTPAKPLGINPTK